MNKYKVLYFLSGFSLGGVLGALAYKIYSDKKREKESAEEYDNILRGYQRTTEVNPEETNTGRDSGILSQEEREKIKERLQKNLKETTNYAAMYSAETEHPVDSDEELDEADYAEPDPDEPEEIDEDEEAAYDATVEHQKNRNKKPKIISYEAVADLPAYIEQRNLFYYIRDNVLANEEEEELEPEAFVGDALWKYDFANNDETEIYVMNYELDTCYTVTKVQGAFADLKVGI